jgi:glutamate-1-semialdehyde 2,1-aminomutase
MAAGIATLKELAKPGFYDTLDSKAAQFAGELEALANKYSIPTTLNRVGSVMTTFFTESAVTDFDSAMTSDTERYGFFYRDMLDQGVYLAPSQFEGAFISKAHSAEDLAKTLEKTESSFRKVAKG